MLFFALNDYKDMRTLTADTKIKLSHGGTPVKIETKNCVAVLDISPENKYIEIVDWRWINDKKEKKLEKKNQMQ